MSTARAPRAGLLQRAAAISDGAIIRAAFFAMLIATAAVLYVDYQELSGRDITEAVLPNMPVLPAYDPDTPDAPAGPAVTTDPAMLRAPLSVALEAGGVLRLTGTIEPGSFDKVQAEVEARGEYVKTVALDSPGGAVEDAIKIGALFEVEGFTTTVAPGALCASSCPLIFAGGKERIASHQSAIGVHQIYTMAEAGKLPSGAQAVGTAMAEVQKTTAAITRYLETTGVDPAIWLFALETPPSKLYYLSPAELEKHRLVTRFSD